MKTHAITYVLLFAVALFASCGSSNQNNENSDEIQEESLAQEESTAMGPAPQTDEPQAGYGHTSSFDINDIPVSTAELGEFPFFKAPEGSEYINRAKPVDFDFIVFVTPDDIYEVEGKTFRAHVHKERNGEKEISGRYLIRSYEEAIKAAGGVKVFEGKLTDERLTKYTDMCTYSGSNGSIDVWNDPIATYVIRREDGNIYIAIDKGRTNTTSVQIVQETEFEQTI